MTSIMNTNNMQGTIILSTIFLITFIIIGIKIYKSFKTSLKNDKNGLSSDFLAQLGVSIFLYGLSIVAAYSIVEKQYNLEKELLNDQEVLEILEK